MKLIAHQKRAGEKVDRNDTGKSGNARSGDSAETFDRIKQGLLLLLAF
jgi:hypothetical protein